MQTEVEATVVFEEKDREKVRTIATLFRELESDYCAAVEDYEPNIKDFKRLEKAFKDSSLAIQDLFWAICGDDEYSTIYEMQRL